METQVEQGLGGERSVKEIVEAQFMAMQAAEIYLSQGRVVSLTELGLPPIWPETLDIAQVIDQIPAECAADLDAHQKGRAP